MRSFRKKTEIEQEGKRKDKRIVENRRAEYEGPFRYWSGKEFGLNYALKNG